MPFIKRIIKPENLCRNNPLLTTSTDILHDQNKFIYINFLKQIPSLSEHTNEILNEIYANLNSISERVEDVNTRIKKIQNQTQKMPMKVSLMTINDNPTQAAFQTTVLTTNILPITVNMPASLRASYEKCLKSPDLDILDALRTDGIKTMKLYSDPLFFFDHWKVVMGKELKEMRKRKKNRTKLEEKKIAELPQTRKAELINKSADIYGKAQAPVIKSRVISAVRKDVPVNQDITPQPIEPPPMSESADKAKVAAVIAKKKPKRSSPKRPTTTIEKSMTQLSISNEVPVAVPEILPSTPIRKSNESIDTFLPPSTPPPPPPPMDSMSMSSLSVDLPPPPMSEFSPPPISLLPPPVMAPPISELITLPKVAPKPQPPTPSADPRDQLLGAIRGGSRLRKVEAQHVEETKAVLDPVAAALAERFQYMAMSDSEGDNSDKNNDDEW